uniref:Uncharacterized protein n=1 Tax=Anguilla anguilla TaxID=7936 RepID=A0A0E9TSI9_ANGAN
MFPFHSSKNTLQSPSSKELKRSFCMINVLELLKMLPETFGTGFPLALHSFSNCLTVSSNSPNLRNSLTIPRRSAS